MQLIKSTLQHQDPPSIARMLREFFDQFNVNETQQEIWNLMLAYNSQPDSFLADAISRSNTTLFCSKINLLLTQLNELWNWFQTQAAKPNEENARVGS